MLLSKLRISDKTALGEMGPHAAKGMRRAEEKNSIRKGEVELLSEPLMSPSLLSFYCIAQAGLESVLWNNVKSTHQKQQSAEIGIH